MNNFAIAFVFILANEGGYVNDPDDNGGPTQYGVSTATCECDVTKITLDGAKEFYHRIWVKGRYYNITDPYVARKLFDIEVHAGRAQMETILDRAFHRVWEYSSNFPHKNPWFMINETSSDSLIRALKIEQKIFYIRLIDQHNVYEKYKNGWLARADRG